MSSGAHDGALVALARRSRAAALTLAATTSDARNAVLARVKDALGERADAILEANRRDLEAAKSGDVDPQLVKRLGLDGKLESLVDGVAQLMAMEDPCNRVTLARELDDGLVLRRVTCPIGVICIIFEARPDAAVQIASLALKSANAIILKGGREAAHSNRVIVDCFRDALAAQGIDANAVQLVSTREEVQALLALDEYIDLVIPRGSNALVRYIKNHTRIPVLGHADGICSVFVDRAADVERAVRVVVDSKIQYPAACNAAETLLVHEEALERVLPAVGAALQAAGVELVADERCIPHLPAGSASPAAEKDWRTEFLCLKMAVKAVGSLDEAVAHVNEHGSHHTDCIVTEDEAAAKEFMARVDSAGVYHNVSTRFADGFRYGFGAEVGVSTNRIHARGPVGLEGLLTYKYLLSGSGHRVRDYAGPDARKYTHKDLA